MNKILFAGVCALAFTATSTAADAGHRKHWRHYGYYGGYYSSGGAAHAQWLYGGNPDAGGGPRGSVQATNNPRASREYGGR
ncbi:MAG: hypothetical protein AB1342_09530 [Pseudomonadota bacterium]